MPRRRRPSCDFPVTFTETRREKNARKPQAVPKKRGRKRRARCERVRGMSEILRIYDEARYREGREPTQTVSTLVQRKRERVKGNGGSLLLARRDTETVEEDNKNVHRRGERGVG